MTQGESPPAKNRLVEIDSASALIAKRAPQERKRLKQSLPELLWLERLINAYHHIMSVKTEGTLSWQGTTLPFYSISLGNCHDKSVPTFLLTGGVHGIERIGSQVLLAWLQSLLNRMEWDSALQAKLAKVHLVLVPMVNPVGMYSNRRANGNGVDLNRNAPIDADGKTPLLVGGHRLGPRLPWYRGTVGEAMEPENALLQSVVRREAFSRPLALSLDLHSGFGMHDRVWFPYAYRQKLIGSIENYLALKLLWERCFPHHNYVIEPQCLHYLSHGDLWDYFYQQAKQIKNHTFIPLTLEMGSWAWVKKRPFQIFNVAGIFHPQKAHRHARVLRRHMALMDFLVSATIDHAQWMPVNEQKKVLKQAANVLWN